MWFFRAQCDVQDVQQRDPFMGSTESVIESFVPGGSWLADFIRIYYHALEPDGLYQSSCGEPTNASAHEELLMRHPSRYHTALPQLTRLLAAGEISPLSCMALCVRWGC